MGQPDDIIALARQWALRAAEELSQDGPDAVSAVRSRAALSGAVAPRDLVRDLEPREADSVLDAAATEFDKFQVGDDWKWTLRTEARKQELTRLSACGEVESALREATDIPTDDAGRILRDLARTRPRRGRALFRRLTREKQDDSAVLQALTWAAPLGGGMGDLAEARRQAGLAAVRDSYSGLVRNGIHGRERELERLREFVTAPNDATGAVPLLTVTGVGGAGKSTLLAGLIGPYLDQLMTPDADPPAVIVIDFDRVLFRVNSEIELSFEVSRQLGWAAPVASADFSVLRHQAREERRQTQAHMTHAESDVRTASGFEQEAATIVAMHALRDRPVLLVLDTFEEWQRDRPDDALPRVARRNDPEHRIQEWIWRLRNEMNLRGLRVIVSGRASIAPMDGVTHLRPLELDDLDPAAAVQVIQSFSINPVAASTLAGIVGGNPLALQVAARFYRNLPRAERRRFIDNAGNARGDLDVELRSALLYSRFLDHIRDAEVRSLAHPGLVLRRVTPSLVVHVLAPHSRFEEMDLERATNLVRRLEDEVWLVKSTSDGLWHHPRVRRAMLRMMSADPAYEATVRAIHRDAADWYRSGFDPELREDAARAEALYHELMLETGDRSIKHLDGLDDTSAVDWARRATTTGMIEDFGPQVRAQVQALRGEELSDEAALGLPGDIWLPWIQTCGARLLADGLGERALQHFEDRLRQRGDASELEWLAQAYCETARWRQYWATVRWIDREEQGNGSYRVNRCALVNAIASRDPHDLADYDQNVRMWREHEDPFFAMLRTGRPRLETPARMAFDRRPDSYPVDYCRDALVMVSGSEPVLMRNQAGVFCPDPGWVRRWARLVQDGPHETFAAQLEELGDRARSDEVLGDWSARFARIWPVRTLLSREALRRQPELVRVLRGDNPELRPAIRLAVGAVADRYGVRSVGRIAADLLPVPVRDLRPEALPRRGSAERKAVYQLVEYVDRSGVMRNFLTQLRIAHPDMGLVRDVADAFNAWDDAHERLLSSIVASLRGR